MTLPYIQVLLDASKAQHGALAILCLAAVARGVTARLGARGASLEAPAVLIPAASPSMCFARLAPLLQVTSYLCWQLCCALHLAATWQLGSQLIRYHVV